MTTDLERRLRHTLEEDASRAPLVERAPEGLRRGVRRRQVRSVAVGAAALVAVVAVAFAGLQLVNGDDRFTPTPAEQHERPVFERTATIEGFTVTSPSDWALVDYWPVMGRADAITQGVMQGQSVPGSEWYPGAAGVPVLQLTNYDPALGAPICGSPTGDNPFPTDGVGLYVGFEGAYYAATDGGGNGPGSDLEAWPNAVSVEPSICGGGTELRFGVRRGDRLLPYLLWYGAGPDASDEARAQLDAIVASFGVNVDQPEFHLPGVDSPGFVVWGGTSDDGSTWTIEARPSEQNIYLNLLTRETDGTYSEGGFADFEVPPKDVDGGFMGVVREDAERVEFRPADGSPPAVAQLTDLPGSLGYDADAYYFSSGYPTKEDAFDGELVAVLPGSSGSSTPDVVMPDGAPAIATGTVEKGWTWWVSGQRSGNVLHIGLWAWGRDDPDNAVLVPTSEGSAEADVGPGEQPLVALSLDPFGPGNDAFTVQVVVGVVPPDTSTIELEGAGRTVRVPSAEFVTVDEGPALYVASIAATSGTVRALTADGSTLVETRFT
jgi:hypothetical protein